MFRFLFSAVLIIFLLPASIQLHAATADSLRFEEIDAAIQSYLRTKPDTVRLLLAEQSQLLMRSDMPSEMLEDLRPRVFNNHGIYYRRMAKLDSALHFFQLAYKTQDSSRNPIRTAIIFNNLANVHFQRGDFPMALDQHFHALSIRRSLGDSLGTCMSLGNIGLVYENLDEAEKARSYYQDALVLAEAEESVRIMAWIYTSLGTLALREGALEEAEAQLRHSIDLKRELEDVRGIGFSMTDVGAVYLKRFLQDGTNSDRDSAAAYLKAALEIHLDQENDYGTAATLNYLGELEMENGKVAEALRYLVRAREIARQRELRQEESRALELESRAYEMRGDYRMALARHQAFKALDDSLFNADRDKEIGRKEAWSQYMHELREDQLRFDHELALKEEERQRKNLVIVVIGLSLLLAMAGAAWLYRRWRATGRAKVLAEEENEALAEVNRQVEEKNKALQARIEEVMQKLENEKEDLPEHMEQLTKREMEVLLSLGLGLTDKEIAERLFISIATVRTHNRKIFEKLHIRSRSEAVGLVHQYRLVAVGEG